MGKKSSIKKSGIQAVNRSLVDNNNLKKEYRSLYNINKKDQ